MILGAILFLTLAGSPPMAGSPLGDDRVPDRVELANGAKFEGRVVFEDASRIFLLTGTGEKSYDRKLVKSFRSRARLHREVFERWLGLDSDHLEGVLQLAQACKQTDLLEDMQCFAHQALLLDPSNADAHKLLGHRKRGSNFDVEVGRDRWVPYPTLVKPRSEWRDAYDLASMHYVVRTNFGIRDALEAALDLECFYRAFYDLFGAALELREVVEPMTVEIHADKSSFLQIASGRHAYTDGTRNWVEIDASSGEEPAAFLPEMLHEATHQITNALTHFSFAGAGSLPGWLGEGLAEHMSASMGGLPGHRAFGEGALLLDHFKVHASAKSPYDLSRVLTFESDDFLASSKSDLKYAQSYTLVQYCMEGEGGKYRAGFFEFLRGVWRGRKASGDFRKALKIEEGPFEKAWLAHVRAHAR